MRDIKMLAETLQAIRRCGAASRPPAGSCRCAWQAGATPLNDQSVQDLIADGWLKHAANGRHLAIDAWPRFAGEDPGAGPSPECETEVHETNRIENGVS